MIQNKKEWQARQEAPSQERAKQPKEKKKRMTKKQREYCSRPGSRIRKCKAARRSAEQLA